MNNMKKFASLLLALVMVLAMAAPAMADVAITVPADDNRTYAVYQIFTGTLHTEGEGETAKQILSDVKWGKNGTGTEGEAVSEEILNALTAVNSKSDTEKLVEIKKYVDLTSAAYDTVSNAEVLNVPTGYYLLVDLGEVKEDVEGEYILPEGEAYSLYVVQIVGPTVVAAKRGTVESSKKVDDENDSVADDETTTDIVEGEDDENWQDSADYDIGDDVPFKLTAKLPSDYATYEKYYLVFHDVESEGLSFNDKSVKVYIDGVEITSGYEVVTETEDGCTFEVVFEDLKKITGVQAGSVIAVTYTSELTEDAVVGSTGNTNTMHVEYTNNPNWDGTGEDIPTGDTPEDKVVVFTYKVIVNKIDEDKNALAGAGFTLYKWDAEAEVVTKDETTGEETTTHGDWVAVGEEMTGDQMTTFTWIGLDDGKYKLIETTTPAGYNTVADIEFEISATHSEEKIITLEGGDLFVEDTSAGSLTTDVVNKAGNVLPETGGMGTTLFYAVGGLLVAGAVVVLMMKKRNAA